MAEDYYPGSDGGDAAPPASDMAQEPADESAEKESFLIPKSALGGKEPNPGDECTFRIVKVHGDEVEVEYVDSEKDESMGDKPEMAESMKGMDSMSSMGA